MTIPSKRRYVLVAPILEYVDLSYYLGNGCIDRVSVGGESYKNARVCNFEWVKRIYMDCKRYNVSFDFHQTGAKFVKDGKLYNIKHCHEYDQAKKGLLYLIENL